MTFASWAKKTDFRKFLNEFVFDYDRRKNAQILTAKEQSEISTESLPIYEMPVYKLIKYIQKYASE